MLSINLFECCKKGFTHMNTWMIRKKLMKHYLKKKILQSLKTRVCKSFEIRNTGEYHDLYVQRNTLSLADIFENFQNKVCVLKYIN